MIFDTPFFHVSCNMFELKYQIRKTKDQNILRDATYTMGYVRKIGRMPSVRISFNFEQKKIKTANQNPSYQYLAISLTIFLYKQLYTRIFEIKLYNFTILYQTPAVSRKIILSILALFFKADTQAHIGTNICIPTNCLPIIEKQRSWVKLN